MGLPDFLTASDARMAELAAQMDLLHELRWRAELTASPFDRALFAKRLKGPVSNIAVAEEY